ncbi:hypothetical protein HanPI659440_Chr01g0032701 [Helianthus annuus]|nr:hypothetical protein HanPI659440_Chr01g0032701 [Helianthus annuus]
MNECLSIVYVREFKRKSFSVLPILFDPHHEIPRYSIANSLTRFQISNPNRVIGSVSYYNPRTLNSISILTLFFCFLQVTPHLQFGS